MTFDDDESEEQQRLVLNEARYQFSLSELLVVTTFAAIGLAGARWLPSGIFAGVAGILALASLIYLTVCEPESRLVRIVGWALLITYVLAAVATVVHIGGSR